MRACQPNQRLKRGGSAAHMKPITQADLARRYGYFLDFLDRSALLDRAAPAAAQVTPGSVAGYVEDLKHRVSSVTVYGSIHKLRRASELIDPQRDFGWLAELEKDLALDMRPRSKADRLILTDVLVECGLTLMAEAEQSKSLSPLEQARQFRNGLMVALLALHPIRLKNFASLAIGRTIKEIDRHWWIVLSAKDTKENRTDERQIDQALTAQFDRYLRIHRPKLVLGAAHSDALWLSSNTGLPMAYNSVARAITETTRSTLGVELSPHMFRTSAASSAAIYAGDNPHLGSALLHHRDPRVTEENYNRATSLSAASNYARIVRSHRTTAR
jgi:integrase